jgi:hypothetical protein
MPGTQAGHAGSNQANTNRTQHGSSPSHVTARARMADLNVKMVPTET